MALVSETKIVHVYPRRGDNSFDVGSIIRGANVQLVDSIVKRIDVYEYECLTCKSNNECQHIQAVKQYVLDGFFVYYVSKK